MNEEDKIKNKRRKMKTETKNRIKELREKGLKQYEIAERLGISLETTKYWLMSESKRKELCKKRYERFKKLPIEKKRELYKKRIPYIKKYLKIKYKKDEEYREYKKQKAKEQYQKKKKKKLVKKNGEQK